MNSIDNSLLKFFKLILDHDYNHVDGLLELRDIAMSHWENGWINDSEHCDIEAYLDERLRLL